MAPKITVHVPREWLLNSNDRMHWREKARRSAFLRRAALAIAGTGWTPVPYRVRAEVDFEFPNRRRRDVHNLMPTVKPLIDGLVDAGLLVDDSTAHLVGPDLRVSDDLCPKAYACSLVITLRRTDA